MLGTNELYTEGVIVVAIDGGILGTSDGIAVGSTLGALVVGRTVFGMEAAIDGMTVGMEEGSTVGTYEGA